MRASALRPAILSCPAVSLWSRLWTFPESISNGWSIVNRYVLLFLCSLSVAVASGQSFQNPQAIHIDGPSVTASVADMNSDGLPDLIVQTGDAVTPSTITVFLADASGNYTATGQINTSVFFPFPCVPFDLNGDNKMDLVCANATPGGGVANVSVYLGNGDGTFQAPIVNSLGYIGVPNALFDVIAVADFNNDGHPDLIVTSGPAGAYASYNFTLLGDGTGHFTVKALSGNLYWGRATVADVNGDGKLDLLMPSGPTVFIGNGDGSFTTRFLYSSGNCIFADFETTGKLSAACGIQGGPLQFLHENADGSFNTSSPIASVSFPSSVQFLRPLGAIDLNGDGILDLALSSSGGLQVMMGESGLTFGDPTTYYAGSTAPLYALTGFLTDMDGDKNPDFVATGPNTVYISYGSATGSFGAPVPTESSTTFATAKAADFDRDGFPDIVTASPSGINFLHGKGDGTFASPVPVPLPAGVSVSNGSYRESLLIGDFNGDGKKDLLIPVGMFTENLLYLGQGNGTFAPAIVIPAQTLPSTWTLTSGSVVADVNKDGKDDVVQVGSTAISVYLSQGDGTFRLVTSNFANAASKNTAIAFADFNGDGILDATVFFADQAIVLTGNGDGSFTSSASSLSIPAVNGLTMITNVPPILAVGDFDGDGKQDVALLGNYINYTPSLYLGGSTVRYSYGVSVYYGNGDSTFSQPVSAGFFYDSPPLNLTATALDPGRPSDLAVVGWNGVSGGQASLLGVLPSHPGRTFGNSLYFFGGAETDSIQFADFDHDGKLDLLASNGASNSFVVLLNRPAIVKETLTTSPQPSLAGKPYTVTATLSPFRSQLETMAGNVSFTVDGTPIAPASLNSNVATQTISTNLTGGDHQITATWAGDDNFAGVSVSTVQHVMDYTLTADSSVSIQTGHTGSIGIHLKSINGFADTLALSCGNLPTYATCTFTNSGPSISSGQTIDAQVTIATAAGTAAQNRIATGNTPMFLALALPGLALVLRRRIRAGLLVVIACLVLTAAQGCGSSGKGGGGSTSTQGTPPGTYTISIVANSKTTQLQHTASVTLTVTP